MTTNSQRNNITSALSLEKYRWWLENLIMFKCQTFSGNKELKRASFSCFVEDSFVLMGSTFDLSEPDEDSDDLFFFISSRSFKFTVTSPMDTSTFLILIPTSLCSKRRDKAQLRTHRKIKNEIHKRIRASKLKSSNPTTTWHKID